MDNGIINIKGKAFVKEIKLNSDGTLTEKRAVAYH
jgi:hypothetical protein